MHSNKHVIWIIPGFASSEADDTCIPMMLDLLKYIQINQKITITIVALQYPFTSEKYQIFGANVYPINGRNKWFRKISVWKKSLSTLESIHKQTPVTLVHSFWLGEAALIGRAFSQQNDIPHICTIMGQDVLMENRHIKNQRLKDVTIIGLSALHSEIFYKNSGRKVDSIVPFGMPESGINHAEKKYDIIGVGSLIPVKNYEMWIEIIELVKQSRPDLKAVLVGDGEQKEELKRLIEQKKLGSTIELAGRKQRSETLQLINQSRLFLHTSKHEGQGYIFVEAMSMKLPILTTPVGYSIENEKIWKGTSPLSFAEEIIHLLNKGDVRINYKFPLVSETYAGYKKYYE